MNRQLTQTTLAEYIYIYIYIYTYIYICKETEDGDDKYGLEEMFTEKD